jgi:YD repeat-containing protein
LKTELVYDGLGRTIQTRQYESATDAITTLQEYDEMGRLKRTSNPYRSGETIEWTTTQYDALGRIIQVTQPGGAVTATVYAGNQTTVTDPASKVRRSLTDALGRLTQVVEDPSPGLNYSTTYCYGTWQGPSTCKWGLDNLASVIQGGQTRVFIYDGLSRLTSADNPESDTINYQYDASGNLTQKTDARGTVTTFIYDDINRLINRNYAVAGGTAATPNVTFNYGTTPTSCGSYSKGRLCSVVTGTVSTTTYAYGNARGASRPATSKRRVRPITSAIHTILPIT